MSITPIHCVYINSIYVQFDRLLKGVKRRILEDSKAISGSNNAESSTVTEYTLISYELCKKKSGSERDLHLKEETENKLCIKYFSLLLKAINIEEKNVEQRKVSQTHVFDLKIFEEDVSLLNKALNNARIIVEQRKVPQMHVFDSKIFEEALRNSNIPHKRLHDSAETEDSLHYVLYFPSGSRMVVAVPMNKSTKKNAENSGK